MDKHGFIRNKELACEEKDKQAIRENPRNIYYASGVFRNKYEIMLECVESDLNTYQNATLHFKNKNVDLAKFFSNVVVHFLEFKNISAIIKKLE